MMKRSKSYLVIWHISAILVITLTGCKGCNRSLDTQKGSQMTIPDEMFKTIRTGMHEPNPCSPNEPDASFRGILINAPSLVSFKKGERFGRFEAFTVIPICGYYHLDVPSPPKYDTIFDGMTLVAINIKTQQRYSGAMINPDTMAPPPKREPPAREVVANISVAGYFNPNLADYVTLPEEPGVYKVHIEYEDVLSNSVQIELIEEK